MGVTKEWLCLAHSLEFTSDRAVCPHGCTLTVEREFRSAPAAVSGKTKKTDSRLRELAARFGLSDMNNRDGQPAAKRTINGVDPEAHWGAVPKGGVFHAGGRIEQRDGSAGGAEKALAGAGLGPTEALPPGMALPIGKVPPPRPNVVHRDQTSAADFQRALNSA